MPQSLRRSVLDDFFNSPPGRPGEYRCDLPTLRAMADRLHQAPRRQDLWMVLYTHQLALPIADYLACADLVTFWTWKPAELERLEENFSRAEAMVRGKSNSPDPRRRLALGCYMWDHDASRPMPIAAVEHQCRVGLEWLRRGRIEAMVFVSSGLADMPIDAVQWTRQWIAEVGDGETKGVDWRA